jgi:hypothetical protein
MLGSLGFYTTRRVFVTALVAAFVYGIWEITKPWVLDIWQLGRAAARVKFTNREFLQMLSGFHAEKSAYRFVRSCRLARKVEQTHDSFRSVSELLLAMDGGAYDASVLPNISTSIHRWNGPMLMSEMARLYEQLSLSPDVLLFPPQIR